MRFASLGSGSEGNALLIESGATRIMIDCGFGLKEAETRLHRLQVEPGSIKALIVTHEHSDHIGGAAKFCAKHGAQLMMTYGTHWAAQHHYRANYSSLTLRCFDSAEIFGVDDLEVHPFPVPHDARQPVQCVVTDGALRIGVLTDVGEITSTIEAALSGCDALMLEANHDAEMLRNGKYPPSLKRRISGPQGHLSNAASAAMLTRIDCSKLQHLVAAHLSQSNNSPEHARAAFSQALHCAPEWVAVACQQQGFNWKEVRA
jgi:phosphoribosyl 1,2-cyclic phosphodiesterase